MDVVRSALADLAGGLRLYRVWMALAAEDIGDQHRRTTLGPFWLVITYLSYVGTFVVVFGRHPPIPNFAAYMATGMLVWVLLQDLVVQSVSLFSREQSFIAGTTLPLSVYVLRLMLHCLIRSGYAALGCLAILIVFKAPVTVNWLWAAPAVVLILLVMPAVIIVFAMAGAFFPDTQFMVINLIRIAMFLTPIFWVRASDGFQSALYLWNPFTHFIEIVREPIITGHVPAGSLLVCAEIGVLLWLAAFVLLGRYGKEVAFLI